MAEAGTTDEGVLTTLGNELDRLVKLFNAGLHADPTKEKVQSGFRDLVLWLTQVIEIGPSHARRPYLAYEDELRRFVSRLADSRIEDVEPGKK
jgi:hypothetical protein